MFGNAGREHMERYGSDPDHYAWIGWKNHKHSVNNPFAQFQDEYTLEDIKAAKMIHGRSRSSSARRPRTDLVRGRRERAVVDEHDLWSQAVEIVGQAMVTDMASTFEDRNSIKVVGYACPRRRPTTRTKRREWRRGRRRRRAARLLLGQRADHLRGARLAEEGEGHELVDSEDTTYGGRWVVNRPEA